MAGIQVPPRIRVLKHETNVVEEMDLDEYLQGVVRAEMGPNYPLEALKAQAIAARSFALAARKHETQAHVCTNPAHCQAWRADHAPRPDQAVRATTGLVLAFGDAIATAFYFGHCDGHTRNLEDVWPSSSPVPYCRRVPCRCGYTQMHGHGVGMCQEGARAMAQQGATASEILQHYYTGIRLVQAGPAQPGPGLPWTMRVEVRPGPRAIAGTLPRAGIPISISDPWGNHWITTSGDKPEHGVGGFEVLLWANATYTVRFLDQEFPVPVTGAFLFLTFEEPGAAVPVSPARLVSRWMSLAEARAWQERFEAGPETRGLFTVEER